MFKIYVNLLSCLLLVTKLKYCTSDPPIKTCSFLTDEPHLCPITDLHLNKIDHEFKIFLQPSFSYSKIQIKDSSIPTLGNGVCSIFSVPYDALRVYNIEELRLINIGIEEIALNAFGRCETLKSLILRDNKIKTLEVGLFKQQEKLRKIDLSNNWIKNFSVGTFFNLKNLKELLLSGNRLKSFSPELIKSCANLEVLRLDSNDLFDLNGKALMENAPNLVKFAFNNNQLRCDQIKTIIGEIKPGVIDLEYEGAVKDRMEPTQLVESIVCFERSSWMAVHYIYAYTEIMEEN